MYLYILVKKDCMDLDFSQPARREYSVPESRPTTSLIIINMLSGTLDRRGEKTVCLPGGPGRMEAIKSVLADHFYYVSI